MKRRTTVSDLQKISRIARQSRDNEAREELVNQGLATGEADLAKDDPLSPEQVASTSGPPEDKPYDPVKHRDDARKNIATVLLIILAITLLFSFITLWMIGPDEDSLRDVMTAFSGPMFSIIGTALGFYFGSEGNRR